MTKICIVVVCLLAFTPDIWGFDLEMGIQRSKPQISYHRQTYRGTSTDLTFVPRGESTILGSSTVLGIGGERWLFEVERARYEATTMMTDSTGTAVTLRPKFQEDRYGVFFREERELAGFFIGGGLEHTQESFKYLGQEFQSTGQSLYLKGGLSLIFGAFRVKADQVHSKVGEHTVKTNSIGVSVNF